MNRPPYTAQRITIPKLSVELGRGSEGEPHFYPIFSDDELARNEDGTYVKVAPGLCITGLEIPDELIEDYTETRQWTIM